MSCTELGLLAPALLTLAVAVVCVRVVVLVVRLLGPRPPRSRTALVVGRQVARDPSTLNPAIVLAAGLALAVFAGQVQALALRNADLRARAVAGADTVLHVRVAPGVDLIDAVDAADPTGRHAMAVQEKAASYDSGTSRIVAVDAPRFRAVTSWSPDWADVTEVASALRPGLSAPVVLHGDSITVAFHDLRVSESPDAAALPGAGTSSVPPPPDLAVVVESPLGAWETEILGPMTLGDGKVSGPLDDHEKPHQPPPCRKGCRLVALLLTSGTDAVTAVSFTVTGVSTDRDAASTSTRWLTAPGWHERTGDRDEAPDPDSVATALPSDDGLAVSAPFVTSGSQTFLVPGDTSDVLPAVFAPTTTTQPLPGRDGVVAGTGLDGQSQQLESAGRAATLPRALGDGVLVDLRNAAGRTEPRTSEATSDVWLAEDRPPDLEQKLVAAGLTVTSRDTLTETRERQRNQPAYRGAVVALTVAAAALLLGLLTLLTARLTEASPRRAIWRSLREAGFRRSALWRLAFVETALPAVLGTVVGAVSGVLTAQLAAPRLPLVDTSAAGPPLDLRLAWPPLVLLTALTLVLVLVVAGIVAASESRPVRGRG
ncbi:FtsX-like permease family protein [uncultured Friedmanniella sp.]|uniref:FtsX-like permease family protein n=1 Tax=uncultured Friedmanniella sp. TaxID=335381 RepID=UPI0035CB37C2